MGWDITAQVRVGRESATCRVQFEGKEIILRGAMKQRFRHAEMSKLSADRGQLRFEYSGTQVAIDVGERAPDWLDAIRNPRTRVQKLGIVAGMKICALGKLDKGALDEIAEAAGTRISRRVVSGADLVLLVSERVESLERLNSIEPALAEKGCVWVLWQKGRADLRHEEVVAAARSAGLVQTRSMGFSEVLTGLRLVRPAKGRRAAP